MRWLGRGRALYKLSIGGHSALVPKDHVCESRSPVRKAFVRDGGYLPCRSLPRAPRWGVGEAEAHRVAGKPRQEDRSWGRDEAAPRRRAKTAWLSEPGARFVRPRLETAPKPWR